MLALVFAVHMSEPSHGGDSGGWEMALFFFILVPAAFWALGLAVFHFARWRPLRWAGGVVILLVAVAMLAVAAQLAAERA